MEVFEVAFEGKSNKDPFTVFKTIFTDACKAIDEKREVVAWARVDLSACWAMYNQPRP